MTAEFRRILHENGKKIIRYPDLRLSCASLLIKNGVDMKQTQQWLGRSGYNIKHNLRIL